MDPLFLGLAPEDWYALGASAVASTGAVMLSLPFGLALGWLLARRTFRGKWAVETLLNLPLVLPPVVTGYLLLTLLGRTGWVGGWLDRTFGIRIAFTWTAVVLAGAVMGFPLMVRSIRLAFQGTDPRLYQAARSLGARPFDAFWSVSLPLARTASWLARCWPSPAVLASSAPLSCSPPTCLAVAPSLSRFTRYGPIPGRSMRPACGCS